MRTRILMLMLVLSGKVAVHGARAQDRQVPPDMPRFETEIVVTPERGEAPRALVSASTVVMDASSLVELPIVHPSEVLSFLPGLSVVRSQFHVTRPVVSARGFFGGGEAEYVLLLVDGLPVADVESGLIDWSSIPVSSIRRIEVARGPGASVYGDSAVGGVIQILTDRYATGGTLTSAAGSFDTFTGDGSYRRRWEQFGLSVSGAARRTGGAFEHSGGHELVGAAAADGARGRFSWRWMVNGHDRHRDDPGFLSRDQLVTDPFGSDPLFRFDELTRHGFSTAVILRHDIPVGRPHARIYASARDENLIRSILLTPGVGDRRARTLSSLTIGASLEGEQTFASAHPLTVRFGLDVSREQLDTSYYSVDENGVVGTLDTEASGYRLRTGLFVSASWAPVERVRVSGAVRWDDISDIGFGGPSSAGATPQRAWSPRMGVVFSVSDTGGVAAFAQVARAFKAPTLDQRFDARLYPDFRGGTLTISNRRLIPQRATNLEAGISGNGSLRWSALAYRMAVDDEIDFDLRTFSYGNIGESRHAGLELEAEGRWWTHVRPAATYVFSRVVDLGSGSQLKNVPRHRVTVAASVDLPWAVLAYARYHRAWGAFLDDANVYSITTPSTLDVRVRRPVKKHTIFLDVINVTGKRYEAYGFTLVDFKGRVVPYVYPGTPRALRAGLTVTF